VREKEDYLTSSNPTRNESVLKINDPLPTAREGQGFDSSIFFLYGRRSCTYAEVHHPPERDLFHSVRYLMPVDADWPACCIWLAQRLIELDENEGGTLGDLRWKYLA